MISVRRLFLDARSTTVNPSFSRFRIEKLAFHRNRYLDHVATLPDLDYVIVVDLDLYRIDIDGIAHAFGQTIPWDAQFANGRISDPCRPELGNYYYDTYALWELGDVSSTDREQTRRVLAEAAASDQRHAAVRGAVGVWRTGHLSMGVR